MPLRRGRAIALAPTGKGGPGDGVRREVSFYEPNRNYPGPIFAIPGTHDSFIIPDTADADLPLVTIARNF